MKKIFTLIFIFLIILFINNKISVNFLINKTSYEVREVISQKERTMFLPLLNFDGRNYFDLAQRGYLHKDNGTLKAFFPIYPGLIYLAKLIFKIDLVFAGILISWMSSAIGFIYLKKLLIMDENDKVTDNTLLLLLFFPTSFYFFSYYTEGIFFLESVLFFYFFRKKQYTKASIVSFFAGATRLVGLIFPLILLIEYFKKRKINIYQLLISSLGFVFYSLYLFIYFKSPLAMVMAQSNWGRHLNIFGPIVAFISWINKLLVNPAQGLAFYTYSVILLEFVCGLFVVFYLFKSYKKENFYYWFYVLISFLLPTMTGSLASMPRYILVLFPIFLFLTKELKKNWQFYSLFFILLILLIYFEALFLRGYWVA